MARAPSSEQVQVNFRMPAELKSRVEAAAEANNRSTTAEIIARLEASFVELSPSDADFVRAIVDRTIDNMLNEGFVLPAKRAEQD